MKDDGAPERGSGTLILEVSMERIPKGWMFTLGLSVLAVVSALVATTIRQAEVRADPNETALSADYGADAQADSCFRYGKVECCVKGE
jgi:hypothetical protein